MGTIYRRTIKDPMTGSKREAGPWWIKYHKDGRPYYESTRTEDKKVAKRLLKKREGDIASGTFSGVRTEKTRFEELAAGIREDYAINRRRSSRRLEDYLRHLTGHFCGMRAPAITTERIRGYIAKRQGERAMNGTINRELACLKRMFRLAYNQTPPKVAGVPYIPMLEEHNVRSGFFTQEEYLAVRGALPDYAQVAITVAYHTGMRISEILGLKWSQVDLVQGRISLAPMETKTETARVVYMTADLYQVLAESKRRQEASLPHCQWVCAIQGRHVNSIKKCWRTACKRVGLEGRLVHDFRRTAIRNMTKAGIPEKVAMAVSGHKTRSVFDRYHIVNEADLKEAATKMSDYYEAETVTRTVTVKELEGQAVKPAYSEGYESAGVIWSRRSGLNGRPAVYETAALPTELRRPSRKTSQLTRVFSQPQGVFLQRQMRNKTFQARRSD